MGGRRMIWSVEQVEVAASGAAVLRTKKGRQSYEIRTVFNSLFIHEGIAKNARRGAFGAPKLFGAPNSTLMNIECDLMIDDMSNMKIYGGELHSLLKEAGTLHEIKPDLTWPGWTRVGCAELEAYHPTNPTKKHPTPTTITISISILHHCQPSLPSPTKKPSSTTPPPPPSPSSSHRPPPPLHRFHQPPTPPLPPTPREVGGLDFFFPDRREDDDGGGGGVVEMGLEDCNPLVPGRAIPENSGKYRVPKAVAFLKLDEMLQEHEHSIGI
ncbi:hypothetical protein BVC80_1639g9 [Macleaya cordata]|uniref:Uncharacterized protein n=1 Tax=Macleaya cordata TaxID=56857 RepID=A0A200Q6S0_MACCD|nr:hypothetical protein BVC80_1639g9 [Macleaya cordata]